MWSYDFRNKNKSSKIYALWTYFLTLFVLVMSLNKQSNKHVTYIDYFRGAASVPGLGLTCFYSNYTDCNTHNVCHLHAASPRGAAKDTEWDWHSGGSQQTANSQWQTKVSGWKLLQTLLLFDVLQT